MWLDHLGHFAKEVIEHTVKRLPDLFPQFPPTLGEFKQACQAEKSAHEFTPPQFSDLQKSVRTPAHAEAMQKIRALADRTPIEAKIALAAPIILKVKAYFRENRLSGDSIEYWEAQAQEFFDAYETIGWKTTYGWEIAARSWMRKNPHEARRQLGLEK